MAMAAQTLRQEERIGLAVAAVLHVALVGVLLLQPAKREAMPEPQRMTVSLAEDVGLEATAPDPVPESRAATAPTLSDAPVPAPPIPQAEQRTVQPPTPAVRPSAPAPAPTAKPDSRERRRPDPSRTQAPPSSSQRSGGSRLSDNFLEGSGSSSTTSETRIPASQIGASAKASVVQALIRQIRPHWSAPQGVDAELLVTELDFDLNEDGSLRGAPRVRAQSGVTDSNRPQQSLHAERAIRAVQLAAPFKLPPEYYNAWRSIRGARFDRNLSR